MPCTARCPISASTVLSTCDAMIANSSPPIRATKSPSRTAFRKSVRHDGERAIATASHVEC